MKPLITEYQKKFYSHGIRMSRRKRSPEESFSFSGLQEAGLAKVIFDQPK
jgi:hypothetical protein